MPKCELCGGDASLPGSTHHDTESLAGVVHACPTCAANERGACGRCGSPDGFHTNDCEEVMPKAPKLSLCACGHTGNTQESDHGPRYQPGHGKCFVVGCACRQFTWVAFVDIVHKKEKKP